MSTTTSPVDPGELRTILAKLLQVEPADVEGALARAWPPFATVVRPACPTWCTASANHPYDGSLTNDDDDYPARREHTITHTVQLGNGRRKEGTVTVSVTEDYAAGAITMSPPKAYLELPDEPLTADDCERLVTTLNQAIDEIYMIERA